jgi:GT2 family glycosyltransferase
MSGRGIDRVVGSVDPARTAPEVFLRPPPEAILQSKLAIPRSVRTIPKVRLLTLLRSFRPALRLTALFLYYAVVKRRSDARSLAIIAASDFFDPAYYLMCYADVAASGMDPVIHYVDAGARELRRPSASFSTGFYVSTTPDLPQGVNPLLHYLRVGRSTNLPTVPRPVFYDGKVRRIRPPPASVSLYEGPPRTPPESRPRLVIYTAVVGGYDDLAPAPALFNCDFVVFSDEVLDAPGWKVRPLNFLHPDPTRAARFVKLHPHLYFEGYEASIWLDANLRPTGDIGAFVDALAADACIATFLHPERDCIYDEGMECLDYLRDDREVIGGQLDRYRSEGVPDSVGLWETNVLVRRHNDERCIALMTAWWRQIEEGSRRDQLSLPVVARRLGVEIACLDRPGVRARTHPLLAMTEHRSEPSRAGKPWPTRPPDSVPSMDTPPSVTIGVCVHNSLDVVRPCLEAAIASRGEGDVIVIVDDCSAEATAAYLEGFAAGHPRVRLIRNPENLGYTRSANLILRSAGTNWIVLLNSDTVLPRRALAKLIAAGERFPRIAIVGPLSNAASWQSVPRLVDPSGGFMVNELPRGRTIEDMDAICESAALPDVTFVPFVNGFCFAIRRSALDRIGVFDEQAFPVGYGEEDDLALRAADAGLVCALATDTYVFHVKSASFSHEGRRAHVAAGARALHMKHGKRRIEKASTYMRQHHGLEALRARIEARLRT